MRKVIGIMVLMVWSCYGQLTPSQLTLTSGTPQGVNGVSATITGNIGNQQFYYWVIANWPVGQSVAVGTFVLNAPSVLTGTNYVTITFNPNTGATNYAVLRTTTPQIPSSCTCALTTNNTNGTVIDQGGALTSFTYSPARNAVAHITLENGGFTQPRILTDVPWNSTTFAKLPSASSSTGLIYLVVDAMSNGCSAGGGTNTPGICWSNGSSWVALGGGGGGGGGLTTAYTVVGSSPTPTFNITANTSIQGFAFTATSNATVTVSGSPTTGQIVWLKNCMDGTGGWTITLPANFTRTTAIDTTASTCTTQMFVYDGTDYVGVTTGESDSTTPALVTANGVLDLPTAPNTIPGTGSVNTYTGTQDNSSTQHWKPRVGTVASITGSTCTTGDMAFASDATAGQQWYYCNSNVWTQQLNSGGGGGVVLDCSDHAHNKCIVENFCAGSVGNLQLGAFGWNVAGTGTPGAITGVTTTADQWCGYNLPTAASANSSQVIDLATLSYPPMNAETVVTQHFFKFRTPATLTNVLMEIGFSGSPASTAIPDTNTVALRYFNDGGTNCNGTSFAHGTDSTWVYYTTNGTGTTVIGPSIATSTDYILRISTATSGTVGFSVAPVGSSLPADTNISTTLPTSNLTPVFKIASCDTTQKVMIVREFDSNIAHN